MIYQVATDVTYLIRLCNHHLIYNIHLLGPISVEAAGVDVTFRIVSCAEKSITLIFSVRTYIMHERRCIHTFGELSKSTFSHTCIYLKPDFQMLCESTV